MEPTLCDQFFETIKQEQIHEYGTNLLWDSDLHCGEIGNQVSSGNVSIEEAPTKDEEPVNLLSDEEEYVDPMEEEPSEHFSDSDADPAKHFCPDQCLMDNSDMETSDIDPTNVPVSPFVDPDFAGYEDEIRLRDEEEAYLSALNDPFQAHLFQSHLTEVVEVDVAAALVDEADEVDADVAKEVEAAEAEEVAVAEMDDVAAAEVILVAEVIPPTQQQPLRRSARNIERGTTKRYNTGTRAKARRCETDQLQTRELDANRQAQLLRALEDEMLDSHPLTQGLVENIDIYCGIKGGQAANSVVEQDPAPLADPGLERASAAVTEPGMDAEAQTDPEAMEEDYVDNEEDQDNGESVLGAFDFDSDTYLSDEEGDEDEV